MRLPSFAVAGLILTATALTACGGGVDKNAYVDQVSAVQKQTQTETSTLTSEIASARTPAQIADKLDKLGQAVEHNGTSLGKITAPDAVTAEHKKYVSLYENFGKSLEALAAKVKKATPATATKILTEASKITSDLATNEAKIVADINTKLKA